MAYTQRITILVLLTIILVSSIFLTPKANAQIITEQRLEQQTQVVNAQLLMTLEEYVKLLQMILIRHLETRLTELQAR